MKKILFKRRYLSTDEGLAAVEFAFVAPFLILLLIGMVDFGLYINQRMQMENVARASAEYVVKGGSEENVMEDVVAENLGEDLEDMDNVEFNGESVCECSDGEEIACGSTCPDGGYQRQFYTFSLTRTYEPLFPYPGIPEELVMTGAARLQTQ